MSLNFKKQVLPAAMLLAGAVTMPAQASLLCTGTTNPTGDFFNGDLTDPSCDLDDVNAALGTSWTAADFIGSKTNWDELTNPGAWTQDEFGLGTLTITDFTDPPATSGKWTLTEGSVAPLFYVDKYNGLYDLYTYMGTGLPYSDTWSHTEKFATSHISVYGVVPVPAAVWLFGSGLLGLVGMARRKKA